MLIYNVVPISEGKTQAVGTCKQTEFPDIERTGRRRRRDRQNYVVMRCTICSFHPRLLRQLTLILLMWSIG
jgi:hypothetical protein